MRGAAYIDGFNLYHAVDDLNIAYLKWQNFRRLTELLARGHSKTVERVVFCTAYFPGDFGKRKRHELFVKALDLVGVETIFGHTTNEPMKCNAEDCGHRWDAPREKETDINVALSLYGDAQRDLFDVAFLFTADSDQAATLKAMRSQFPQKRVIIVAPPRRPASKHLRDLAHATINLTEDHLDQCVLPGLVTSPGRPSIIRPVEYAPPPGWRHPDDRP